MLFETLLIFLISPAVSGSITAPAPQLFRNTLTKWGVVPRNSKDRSERWERMLQAQEAVERTTTGIYLEALNIFSIMNDEEFAIIERQQKRMNASSIELNKKMDSTAKEPVILRSRKKRSVTLPATYDYWENEVGFVEVKNQLGCGSCWSFPTTGALEAIYKEMTGEEVNFSEQYFVDCTFDYDGCSGGVPNAGYSFLIDNQYLKSTAALPYTGFYDGCDLRTEIESKDGNAFTKLWIQAFFRVAYNENAFLTGLVSRSPVAYLSLISNDFGSYSGGDFTDTNCVSDAIAHVMLLVGYTETTFRIRASYGTGWGDNGYVNYNRLDADRCELFNSAFTIALTYQREIEYEYCSEGTKVTYETCKQSCADMNTGDESGWTLAIIPTNMHNTQLVSKLQDDYGADEKSDDSFNLFWIGLEDINKTGNIYWVDDFTPINYNNKEDYSVKNKYGLMHKVTGLWSTKNSLTYKARGLCSRATTCWDCGTAVKGGTVTFSNTARTAGTTASIVCNSGTLNGASKLTCEGGRWSDELPTCSDGDSGTCKYKNEAGSEGVLEPQKSVYNNGEQVVVSCYDGTSHTHNCQAGSFVPSIASCSTEETCNIPNSDIASVVPEKSTYEKEETITATCKDNTTIYDNFQCSAGVFKNSDGESVSEMCGACALIQMNIVLLLFVGIIHLLKA